jgi:hypothetical protein
MAAILASFTAVDHDGFGRYCKLEITSTQLGRPGSPINWAI